MGDTNITIGLLAHVDAGKTTFAEQLLYHTNSIRSRGRVDHKDAFLDSHELERARGITIFADQAVMTYGDSAYDLIDTRGTSISPRKWSGPSRRWIMRSSS
ncbi:Tetracycline resistance protein TetO [Paenibacillus sp. P1XP2]|nr:Tetracycline resistance protein TetO [Paenibacillus sp. P1XP2]